MTASEVFASTSLTPALATTLMYLPCSASVSVSVAPVSPSIFAQVPEDEFEEYQVKVTLMSAEAGVE